MSTENKMTLTRALVELKKLDTQIQRAINTKVLGYTVGTGAWEKVNDPQFSSKENAAKAYTSAYDSVNDLILRRTKIKSAVVVANSTTKVKIANEELTIAEAIERKSSIKFKVQLLDSLKKQHAQVLKLVENNNSNMNFEINKIREQVTTTGKSDDGKLSALSNDIRTKSEAALNDPIKILEKIQKLESEIDDFVSNVDVVLSEANATTTINLD